MTFPYPLMDDPKTLSGFDGWSESVYQDFFRVQRGEIDETTFRDKYHRERAVLSFDMTGYTSSAMHHGELQSFIRIMNAQRVVVPVLQEFGAELIRCFADDIVALFLEPDAALDAAFESHRRVQLFNESSLATGDPTLCCAGIGFGRLFAIGPNLAQGDEMNQASKLGEDIARANETLVTERAYAAFAGREDVVFEQQNQDDQLFSFYRAVKRD